MVPAKYSDLRSEESKENIRQVYEKSATKPVIVNSKNPNADFNNPNNPNYKGRLTHKIIDAYLPKNKAVKPVINIFKEKEELFKEKEVPHKEKEYSAEEKEIYKQRKQEYTAEEKEIYKQRK